MLGVDCAYLAELSGNSSDRLRTLAVFRGQRQAQNFEQPLSGTAAGQVFSDSFYARSKDVREIFPEDAHVRDIGAQGYAGIRLADSAGQPVGLLAIAGKQPLVDVPLVKSVLEAFAPRAAAEIERKRNDDCRRENEERYHAFFASNPDAMWRLEFDPPVSLDQPAEELVDQLYRAGYLAECNDASAKLFGRERAEELLGLPFEIFVPRADPQLQADLRAAIRSGFRDSIVEGIRSEEDGRQTYRLRIQFGIVENGALRRLWGNTRDITDLRQAELSAAASERQFREVLEGIHLPALMLDSQGAITFANEAFLRLIQRSRAELESLKWLEGVVAAAESKAWKETMLPEPSGSATLHFEGEVRPRDGSRRLVQWDAIRLRSPENQVSSLAAIGRDMTYQHALESQIRQVQKLEGIARLAAGVAHDFNNLLMIVMGHASRLLAQVTPSDRAYGSLVEIVDSAKSCTRLTERLLAFGRKQPLKPQLIDLNEVIADSRGLLSGILGSAISLRVNLAAPLMLVRADPTQIQEVLANLASNARDAMPQGGILTIETANVEIGEEDAAHAGIQSGSYVQLSFIDTGMGVADEVLAHLFEPFFTTKAPGKGTGLGLSTVHGIVTQSGGHITVRSERGKGTTFEILLPAPPPVVH